MAAEKQVESNVTLVNAHTGETKQDESGTNSRYKKINEHAYRNQTESNEHITREKE